MENHQNALQILRRTGAQDDDRLDLAQAALALASLEKPATPIAPYQDHLDALAAHIRAAPSADRLNDQLRLLRRFLVVQHKYQGDENQADNPCANNLMDVIDQRQGSSVLLGILYLHVAQAAGWAMTGLDLSGHFLLRLSARDGQVLIDPFRAGQTCYIEEVEDTFFNEDIFFDASEETSDEDSLDFSSALLRTLSHREVLLRLQHDVKRRLLLKDQVEPAIEVLQSMLLFAPKQQDLWREIGYLQAERGHIHAAIDALETVRNLGPDPMPLKKTDGLLQELRWRLN